MASCVEQATETTISLKGSTKMVSEFFCESPFRGHFSLYNFIKFLELSPDLQLNVLQRFYITFYARGRGISHLCFYLT